MHRTAFAAILVSILACGRLWAAEPAITGLVVNYHVQGLRTLSYAGVELLSPEGPSSTLIFANADGSERVVGNEAPSKVVGTGADITRTISGVDIRYAYQQKDNRLNLALTITNHSQQSLLQARLVPFTVRFPQIPSGNRLWKFGYQVAARGFGDPTVVLADYGSAVLAACTDTPNQSVTFGFAGNFRNSLSNPVLIETLYWTEFDDTPPLAPGSSLSWSFSFRFGPKGSTALELAGDVYRAFAKANPATLKWTDHRPIGGLFLARDATRWTTNPRGYFNDESIDVATPTGRETLRTRTLEYADRSIAEIKRVGGQGMITWDIEGGELPHAITYLGDPRILPQVAPEMDAIADAYFQRFRDAGLRTGICIRPSRIVFADPVKYPWIKERYGHTDDPDAVTNCASKIAYAKKRWGCTLFYMDTNYTPRIRGGEAKFFMLTMAMIQKLHQLHPDVLIIPEFSNTGYYGVGSAYHELGSLYHTPEAVRAVYPNAFSVLVPKDDPLYPHWDEILTGLAGGDLLLFRGWFGDHLNDRVHQAHAEAALRGQPVPAAVTRASGTALAALLRDTNPQIRYHAASAMAKIAAASSVNALVETMRTDSEWPVRKRCAEALGSIGGQTVIAPLSAALNDPALGIQYFAALALSAAGEPAVPALRAVLDSTDPHAVEFAATALARIHIPSSTATLISLLSRDGDAFTLARRIAAESLGSHGDVTAVEPLIAYMSSCQNWDKHRPAASLGELADKRAIPGLIKLLEATGDNLDEARYAAMFALEHITGLIGNVEGHKGGGLDANSWRTVLNLGNK